MVSMEVIFKRYKYFFLLASLFVLGSAAKSFAAFDRDDSKLIWWCGIGETKCCVNGTKSCCEDNGTLYDTWSCDDSSCGASGRKEYKYTASGCSYTTSTRTCCSSGSWSGWDESCPTTKTCPTSSKPDSKTTCTGGYKTRTVTCNTSTGTWTTGSWGECDCSDPEFESVTVLGGGTCCQRKDGTGVRCGTYVSDPSWHLFCPNCCNGGSDTAVSSLSACGTCTESMANQSPSYQCCVKSSGSGVGPGSSTTINGYVCRY